MEKNLWAGLLCGLLLLGMAGLAQAVSITDMQLNAQDADAAFGPIAGNDDEAAINALLIPGGPWSFIAKDDSPGGGAGTGTYAGIDFSVSATAGTSGTWDLTWSGSGLPVQMDFVAVLKGANDFAAYLFSNEMLVAPPGTNSPDDVWTMTLLTPNGKNNPDLSHLSLYGRESVPEPATLLLMGSGLVGLAATRRRKARQQD